MSTPNHLTDIVETAYRVFARYQLTFPLHCCDCEFCVTPEMQKQMIADQPRAIKPTLVSDWEGAAAAHIHVALQKGASIDDGWAREVRALLPRMMELLVAGEEVSGLGFENALRVVDLARWRDWPDCEQAVLIQFVEAFFMPKLVQFEFVPFKAGPKLARGITGDRVIVALAVMGLDVDQIAEMWARVPDPAGAVHLAQARGTLAVDWPAQTSRLDSVWLEEHPERSAALGGWLAGPEVEARLEAAFFAVEGQDRTAERLRAFLSAALR